MVILSTYRSRLIAFTFVLVFFLLATQLYSFNNAQDAVLHEAERSLLRTSQLFEAHLKSERSELERFATIVRDDKRLKENMFIIVSFDSGRDLLQDSFEKQFGWLPIDDVIITDNAGNLLLGDIENPETSILKNNQLNSAQSFYRQGKQGLELVASIPVIHKSSKIGTTTLIRRLNNRWLEEKKNTGVGQLIIEKDGKVLMSTLPGFVGADFNPSLGQITFQGETYRLFLAHFPQSESNIPKLWFGASVTEMTKGVIKHRNETLAELLVGFIFILLLAWLFGRNFERPLAQLTALTREISSGKLPEIQKSLASTELDILTNQFIDMIQALREKDSQVKRVHEQLEKTAVTDALTGLYNRRAFESSLIRIVENAQLGDKTHALCYLDLDQFKIVNDTCGHESGDELLRQLTALLSTRLRGSDVLARLGGDEFGLIMSDIKQDQALHAANEVLEIVREFKFYWDNKIFDVGVSIGLVMIDHKTETMADILKHADIACYAAKNEGRNRIHCYEVTDKESTQMVEEINWLQTLRDALHEDRFQLWYQPIVKTGYKSEIEHGEILLRLIDTSGKIVSPGAFIPAAERYHFMPQIDRWVIKNTLKYIKEKLKSTNRFMYSINLSGLSLNDPTMCEYIADEINSKKINASVICFEITETAAIHNLSNAIAFVAKLKGLGCKFALDDFGAGLSTFRHLRHLPVDYIKIDGGFVTNIIENKIDEGMVEAINKISHLLGKKTIAEFVETEEVHKKLEELKVDYVQGYLLGKPQPLENTFKNLVK